MIISFSLPITQERIATNERQGALRSVMGRLEGAKLITRKKKMYD